MSLIGFSNIDLMALVMALIIWGVCRAIAHKVTYRSAEIARLIGSVLVPLLALFFILDRTLAIPRTSTIFKVEQTVIWLLAVWVITATLKWLFLRNAAVDSARARTPRLLIGIFRLSFLLLGAALIVSGIWQTDLSPILTTFGVSSIVLGLALQDTLGNLFAGLALVFDRPFSVGDWIQVGDAVGKVREIHWRSVRIVTRELNELTIPNLTLAKERICNYSTPSDLYGVRLTIGFSYEDQPNTVKQLLSDVALGTPGIVAIPPPEIRTLNFNAGAVDYELLFFIDNYEPLNRIRNEFMTRVWYAAKRKGLTIPYPITTFHKPEKPKSDADQKRELDLIGAVRRADLFRSLTDQECAAVVQDSSIELFARGEYLFKQGALGNSLYIVLQGELSVEILGEHGGSVQLSILRCGDIIGEMSMFTGEPRRASVVAISDVQLARIDKRSMEHLLANRSELINDFVSSISVRLKQAADIREQNKGALQHAPAITLPDVQALKQRIRRFFGL